MGERLRRLASNRWLRWALATLLSLAALALAARGVDWTQVILALSRIDPLLFLLAGGTYGLVTLATAARWRRMFAPRPTPGLARFFWALMAAQLANTALPGRAGLLARIFLVGEALGKTATLCTIILEKALEAITLLIAFLLVVPFLQSQEWLWPDVLTSAALFVLVLAALFVFASQRQRILGLVNRWRWSRALAGPIATALETLEVTRRPGLFLELCLWSALIWVLTVLVDYWLLLAMGITVPLAAAWLLNVFVQVGVRVPSAPASIGVFHYVTMLALGLFGVDQSVALSYALVLHVLIFLPPSLAAIGYLWRQGYDWRAWRWTDGGSA